LIISVSRRTDIPAFYAEWFFNRLNEGYVLVRNPLNFHQVSKVSLKPEAVDCIVFWTKDPANMLAKLDLLQEYNYYFLVTITPYDNKIERNVPPKRQVIDSFIKLSAQIGKERVIWRYDPVVLTDNIDAAWHRKNFELLAAELKDYTNRCHISFVDMYRKINRNMQSIRAVSITEKDMLETGKGFAAVAAKYGLKIYSCTESYDLMAAGIDPGSCIDGRLIAEITGRKCDFPKDKNQRAQCNCAASVDIGAYNSCRHGCLYCYANFSETAVKNNILKHDPASPLLIGNIEPEDIIIERKTVK